MKKIILALVLLILHTAGYSQNPEEEKIRQLENEMKDGFLKRDTIALYKLLSPDFVVNSPFNRVSTLPEIKINLRKGGADTLSFEKNIEKITFTNGLAIVMGEEVRKATGQAVNAGKTFQRRFTDIWIKQKNNWQLLVRQSTVFKVE